MIVGEVRRHLRDFSPLRVSRSLKDIAYRAMQGQGALTAAFGRDPTVVEIANEIGLPKENVVLALEAIVDPVSLYEPVFSDGGDTIYVMDQVSDHSDDGNWVNEIAIPGGLPTERPGEKIIALRFFKGKTQMEVSAQIGISQAQVSRLEKGALAKVKGEI